jgi:hypothetical protein
VKRRRHKPIGAKHLHNRGIEAGIALEQRIDFGAEEVRKQFAHIFKHFKERALAELVNLAGAMLAPEPLDDLVGGVAEPLKITLRHNSHLAFWHAGG